MAIVKIVRNKMPMQDATVRAKNFSEVNLGFNLETAKIEAARCLNCKNALCVNGCPVGVRIPEFIQCVLDGDIVKAGEIIKSTNSLPAVCGRVCPQEEQCEKLCIRGKIDEPVAIGSLERFVGDYIINNNEILKDNHNKANITDNIDETQISKRKLKSKCAAIIGSGPAGLTCAAELSKAGFDVTIYEALHKAGGVLVYGIPEFRLPKKLVQSEIDALIKNGVKINLSTIAGKTITIEEILEKFDAIFIGSGAGLPMFMNIKGENLNGVYSANEYLTRVNLMKAYEEGSSTPIQRGKNVTVIGAGNVAMDAARTALRLGADNVFIVYRRGVEEMPARREEIHHAEEEGIKFHLLTNPIEMIGENGWVKSLKCIKMELGEPDSSGRSRPVEIVGSEFVIETDMVIVALGTSPNPLIKDSYDNLNTSKKGTIVVDEDMMTNIDNVYAGGDAVTGAATVILAMGAGRKAAAAIINKAK